MFLSQREEVTGGWRTIHKEELHNLQAKDFVRTIKSVRTGLAGHVVRMGEMGNAYKIGGRKT
jgi:hypothetical protein